MLTRRSAPGVRLALDISCPFLSGAAVDPHSMAACRPGLEIEGQGQAQGSESALSKPR